MTTISRDELMRRCAWVSNQAMMELIATGDCSPALYFGKGSGPDLYVLPLNIIETFLNDGDKKEFLFTVVRLCVEAHEYDCVIMLSDTWHFVPDPKAKPLTLKQYRKNMDYGFRKLEKMGYGKAVERIAIVGQTPSNAVVLSQDYTRGKNNKVVHLDPPDFGPEGLKFGGGRMTMFGDWNEPGMADFYAKVKEAMNVIPGLRMAREVFPEMLRLVRMEAPQ